MGHALGQSPRVDENQRAAMRGDQLGQPGVDFGPLLVGANGRQLAGRHFDRQIELARVSLVDDAARRLSRRVDPIGADQKPGNALDRPLRGRKPDPHRRRLHSRARPFQRQAQVRAALVAGQGVNLVDDHRLDRAQQLAALVGRQQQIERLGRGDQNVRRMAQHRLTLRGGRIAGAHRTGVGALRRPLGQRPIRPAALRDCDGCRCRTP